ncbi:23018_t:CDS:1, partial [Gigaspora rosea]
EEEQPKMYHVSINRKFRSCLKDMQLDRQTARYAQELRERQQKYLFLTSSALQKKKILKAKRSFRMIHSI